MKPAETERLYVRACRERRLEPQQEEGQAWHKAVKQFELRDVEAGLERWSASTERDAQGNVKSKWLPVASELRALAEAAKKKREAAAAEPQDVLIWQCEKGHRFSRYIPRKEPITTTPGQCSSCGAPVVRTQRMKP